ncbi:MAG: hypothetical protein Q7U42_01845, partial [Parvibaculum sp.]|nr:hypothetical protein [Parvibaculum sp.]
MPRPDGNRVIRAFIKIDNSSGNDGPDFQGDFRVQHPLAARLVFYIITIMPKKIDHDARRRDIARAAISVIGEQGIDNTRLVDVARAAH